MSIVLTLILFCILTNLSRTIQLNKTGRTIQDRNEINNRIAFKLSINKKYNYFFITNGTRINQNIRKLFYRLNNPNINTAIIEKYKNKDTELLYTELSINNEKKKFLIDFCSDNSFIFEKKNSLFNKTNILQETEKTKDEIKNIENNTKENSDLLRFQYNGFVTEKNADPFYLNNKKMKTEKIINIQNEIKNFTFYQICHEELSKNFDGIIGFDFFKKFDNFSISFKNNIIKFNQEQTNINPDLYYDLKLYDYKKNIKYVNVNIDGHLYKGFFDTASKYSIINSKIQIEKEDYIIIQNILKDTYKVKKKPVVNFHLISNKNKLIDTKIKNVYLSNLDFLEENVVLIGLDFLQDKNLFFHLTNNILYISKGNIQTEKEQNKNGNGGGNGGGSGGRNDQIEQSIELERKRENYFEKTEKEKATNVDVGIKVGVVAGVGEKTAVGKDEGTVKGIENMNMKADEQLTGKQLTDEQLTSKQLTGEQLIDEQLIEKESRKIYEMLKNKELNFLKITKDMEKENIYLKDCKTTNDIIKKYATKLLYGSEFLKKNEKIEHTEEEFDLRYNEITSFFKKLNNEEKQNMLNKIINIMKKSKEQFEKASEILEEFVNFEIEKNQYSLHKFKSCNVGKHNEKAYNDEFQNLYDYYTKHTNFSFEILNDFKKELASKKINIDRFNDEQELIKKVAECRVYSINNNSNNMSGKDGKDGKRNRGMKRNIIVRRYSNDDNNIHTQIIIRRNNISDKSDDDGDDIFGGNRGEKQSDDYDSLNRMDDLFPNSLFSNIFRNFFGDDRRGDSSMETHDATDDASENIRGRGGGGGEEEDVEGSENDIFSELHNLFGLGNFGNNIFRKKKKSVLGFKTKEPEIKNDQDQEKKEKVETIEQSIKEENDVDVIYLLNKVDKLNDINLKNFILQSLKNQNVRKILVNAVKKGYDKTMEECKKENDNKGIYLLHMLKQSGIF